MPVFSFVPVKIGHIQRAGAKTGKLGKNRRGVFGKRSFGGHYGNIIKDWGVPGVGCFEGMDFRRGFVSAGDKIPGVPPPTHFGVGGLGAVAAKPGTCPAARTPTRF